MTIDLQVTVDLWAKEPILPNDISAFAAVVPSRHGAAYGTADSGVSITLTGTCTDGQRARQDAVDAIVAAVSATGFTWTLGVVDIEPYPS